MLRAKRDREQEEKINELIPEAIALANLLVPGSKLHPDDWNRAYCGKMNELTIARKLRISREEILSAKA